MENPKSEISDDSKIRNPNEQPEKSTEPQFNHRLEVCKEIIFLTADYSFARRLALLDYQRNSSDRVAKQIFRHNILSLLDFWAVCGVILWAAALSGWCGYSAR